MDELGGITVAIVVVAIVVVIFLILREFWTWYWKINQLVDAHKKTNMLLQQMLGYMKIGSVDEEMNSELLIQNTSTGETRAISRSEWDSMIADNPQQKKYRIIKENKQDMNAQNDS